MRDNSPKDRTDKATMRLSADKDGIARASRLLAAGALVAFPTETVYGLGADARNGAAVAAIYEAKGRPSFNPLIAHIQDRKAADALAVLPAPLCTLAEAFWPGPVTLVAPLRPGSGLSSLVTAGLDTVALRVPDGRTARALLTAFGGPVAAPSANLSGQISATTADHVLAGLNGRIAAVLDDGPTEVGVESTILGMEGDRVVLLRPGGLTLETIAEVTGIRVSARAATGISAPGQLASHYAPKVAIRLNAEKPGPDEAWLDFGGTAAHACALDLSPGADLREAAANLFGHLHQLDAMAARHGITGLAVAPIPAIGLGVAINDRLGRAAAPRPDAGDPAA